ncbi:uncharacterized protein C57A7.06 [Cryptomeria japonica]|uniref:uncharacterized protein C57A7.06 n=1 Tax=Cryptomeria japonica TaxID=3369 RepID=UPI0027DA64C4|nr:uncharacterized protein C57A7.06 [Cryptomeria japonica]XP_057822017.2 uncharacterized protein C57A7.06 [Cryptomeria japonica]
MARIVERRTQPIKGKKLAKKSPIHLPRPPPKVNKNKKNKSGGSKKSRVPRLPFSLKKEIDIFHPISNDEEDQNDGDRLDGDEYEYEEDSAQEDTKKNKRYDQVDNLEYELPSDFEDEEIDEDTVFGREDLDHSEDDLDAKGMIKVDQKGKQTSRVVFNSDEEDGMSESEELSGEGKLGLESDEEDNEQDQVVARRKQQGILSDEEEEENEEEEEEGQGEEDDDEKHQKMLQDVTGRALDAFEGMKRKKKVVISEAYPESEYNLDLKASRLTESLSVQDLMAPLYGNSGFGSLRRRMHQLEKNAIPVQAPLPKVVQARLERKAAYANAKEEIKKWQPLVKRNREASIVNLAKKVDVGKSGTGAIAFAFKPTTDLEKDIASLLQDAGVVEAQTKDGAELLELNKVTLEEVRERQGRLAKMRSLMFRHELKAKHIKKIKSKTYHRLLKKERRKAGLGDTSNDPEAAKEYAMKQEFKRAEERMTLRHKNTSKWAKRAVKRGLQIQDEGTKAALAEQLRMNTLLTRKIHSMNDDSSSDESSSEDDYNAEILPGSDGKLKSHIIARAKEDTLKVLEGEEEDIPKSGILSLPFMVRGMEKRKKQAHDEAVTALEEYESALRAENTDAGNGEVNDSQKGRLVFGDLTRQNSNKKNPKESKIEIEDMLVDKGDGSEDDSENDMVQDSMHNHNNTSFTNQVETDHKLLPEGLNLDFYGLHGMEGSVAPTMTKTAGPVYVGSSNKQDVCVNKNVLFDSHSNKLNRESTEKMFISKAKKSTQSEVPNSNKWLFGECGAKMSEKLPAEIDVGAAKNHKKQQRKSKQENEGKIVPNVQERNGTISHAVSIAGGAKVNFGKISKINVKEISDPGISSNEISSNHRQSPDKIDSSCGSEEEPERKAMPEGMVPIDGVGSQADLIQRAFAADDVEAEFEQAKAEAVNEEVPTSEIVDSLPGWGQWTHIQQKKGLPSWILQQQEEEKRKREEALRKRKDAKLKFVVISEKLDKKAAKYSAPSLPFPYQSKEVFERSMRMPIGPEFNTIHAFQNMIRPTVIKKAGVVIDPIKYEKEQQPKDEILHSAMSSRKRKSSNKSTDQNSNKNKKGFSKDQHQTSKKLPNRF